MLALLMLPLGVGVYVIVATTVFEVTGARERTVFLVAGVISALVVVAYWTLLWRGTVRWTRERVAMTVVTLVAALACGGVAGALGERVDRGFGVFLSCPVFVLLWLLQTIFVWRETGSERASRLRGATGSVIACPQCGYNLTGLGQAVCPECGSRYTLEELLAGQRGSDADLEERG